MDAMNVRAIILSLFLSVMTVVPVSATVAVEQFTDPEFVVNQGYSQLTAEDVFMSKSRAAGKPIEPLYPQNQNALVRGWKAFWGYIDPAHDEVDRIHHNIKPSASFSDL